MGNRIKLNLSSLQVDFKPDDFREFTRTQEIPESGDFQVTLVNTSSRFASFQLELIPQGVETQGGAQWYRVDPSVSAKKPPGDRTTFHVTLLRSPMPRYDVTIPITVRAFSVDVEDLEGEDTLWLKVVRPNRTLQVYLPFEELSVHPGDRLSIPALVYNLSPKARRVTLQLKGLDPLWFPEGTEQSVQVDAGDSVKHVFWFAPPASGESRCDVYPIRLEGLATTDDARVNPQNTATAFGSIEILPFGEVQISCLERQQWIPARHMRWTRKRFDTACFELLLQNRSNVALRVGLPVTTETPETLDIQTVEPFILESPTETSAGAVARVNVQARRPWLGMTRTQFLNATPTLAHAASGEAVKAITVKPSNQVLELKVRPIVPFLLQIGGGLLGLLLLWLLWLLNPGMRHNAPIYGLTLMANGSTVVSGSSDGALRRWQVRQDSWLPDVRRLQSEGELRNSEYPITKAVRTLRHLPSEVKQVAVGLENGEIQIWDISPANFRHRFFEKGKPDRVFALDFTSDSRVLLSGHGSGMVRLWDMEPKGAEPERKLYPPGNQSFAIAALSVIEAPNTDPMVAVGGQFNRLVLWNWRSRVAYNLSYSWQEGNTTFAPVVSRQSYITALDASVPAKLIASADNQGFITLWNMEQLNDCMERAARKTYMPFPGDAPLPGVRVAQVDPFGNHYVDISVGTDCAEAIADQWSSNSQNIGVRALALTENGCYLASAGDDGRVMLWSLTNEGTWQQNASKELAQFPASLNSVDIHYTRQGNQEVVLVVSDTPRNQVRLYREQVTSNGCQ